LIDGVNRFLDVPQTVRQIRICINQAGVKNLLLDRNILAYAAEFALESDARGIEWTGLD
jgi:hypothetical protein